MAEKRGTRKGKGRPGKGRGRAKGRDAKAFRESMISGPTEAEYRQFERSQQAQFTPAIRELRRQSEMIPAMDPRVRELERQMGAERSTADIQQEYATRLANLQGLITSADTGSAGRGVSTAIGALGSALGVEAAPEIAGGAGAVTPTDAISRVLLAGAASQFAGLEQQTLGERADRLQRMGLSKAEALKEARQERRQTRLQLAELLGQRRAATADPLQRTLAFLQLDEALKARSGGGGYGGYGGGGGVLGGPVEDEDVIPEPGPGGVRDEAAARAEFRNRNRNVDYSGVTGPGRAQGYGAAMGAAQPYAPYTGGWTGRTRPKPPSKPPRRRQPGTPRGSGSPYGSR